MRIGHRLPGSRILYKPVHGYVPLTLLPSKLSVGEAEERVEVVILAVLRQMAAQGGAEELTPKL